MAKEFYDYIFKIKKVKINDKCIINIAKIIANDRMTQYATHWELLSDNVRKHYLEQAIEIIKIINNEMKL